MPFCSKCGNIVNTNFCLKCGSPALAASGEANAVGSPNAVAQASPGTSDNVAGALCYLAGLITGIIFLALPAYNRNTSVRFHALQSILFHVSWLALLLGEMTIGIFLPFSLSLVLSALSLLVWGGGLLFWLYLIWKTYTGQKITLPIIGTLAEKYALQQNF